MKNLSDHLALEGRDARRHLRQHGVEEVRDQEAREVHQWEHELDSAAGEPVNPCEGCGAEIELGPPDPDHPFIPLVCAKCYGAAMEVAA